MEKEKSIQDFIENYLYKSCSPKLVTVKDRWIYVRMQFTEFKRDYIREAFEKYKEGTDFEDFTLAFLVTRIG